MAIEMILDVVNGIDHFFGHARREFRPTATVAIGLQGLLGPGWWSFFHVRRQEVRAGVPSH